MRKTANGAASSGGFQVKKQLTCRVADSGDEPSILKIFEEVAPEVPTAIRSGTEALIQELVASGQSLVAVDADGELVGYALAKPQDRETLALYYLGISKAARNQHASSALVAKLKEIGAPIVSDVRSDNKSSMLERFEHFGFVKTPTIFTGNTKLRWDPPKDPPT
jgi:ribosomal protein S18 acetylase RimI-like enzyme